MGDFSQQLAEPPACGKSVVWGWGTVSGRCRAEKRGSRAQIWKPWAHISPLLTSQPIPTLTLRLFICEMEVSLIPAPHCHGDERTGGCGPTPRRPSQGALPRGRGGGESPASSGDTGDLGSASASGRSVKKETATRSSFLAWEILWTEEPGGLQTTGFQSVRRD